MEPKATHYETLSLFVPTIDGFNDKFYDALNYIHDIKTQFTNNPEKYFSSSAILKETTAARIRDNGEIVTLLETPESDFERIRAKLQGGDGLIARFDTYVPPKYKGSGSSKPREVERKKKKKMFEELTLCKSDADKTKKKIMAVAESFLANAHDKLTDSTHLLLLRILYNYSEGRMGKYQLELMVGRMIPAILQELQQFLKQCENIARMQPKEREMCERSTPNYVFDSKVCPSFKLAGSQIDRKQQIMNKIEDEKLEMTLLLEWFQSAIIHAKFLMGIDQGGKDLDQKELDENLLQKKRVEHNKTMFEILFNRCLERIDIDNSLRDLYEEKSETALRIILGKFEEKQEGHRTLQNQLDDLHREAYKKHWSSKKENDS